MKSRSKTLPKASLVQLEQIRTALNSGWEIILERDGLYLVPLEGHSKRNAAAVWTKVSVDLAIPHFLRSEIERATDDDEHGSTSVGVEQRSEGTKGAGD